MDALGILQGIGSCFHGIGISQGLMLSLFLAGIVGGFTHCAAMCGPFVMSQTGNMTKLRDAALVPYHMGRITTYIALAVLLGSVLNLAFLFLPIRGLVVAPILMLAGLIFFVSAFPRLKTIFPWAGAFYTVLPQRWIAHYFSALSQNTNMFKQYLMGMLLGFMPCGLIVSALMASSTAPSALESGFAMAAFGVGTMPALILTAFGGHALKMKYPFAMQRVRQGLMIWSGLWLFGLAGMMLI